MRITSFNQGLLTPSETGGNGSGRVKGFARGAGYDLPTVNIDLRAHWFLEAVDIPGRLVLAPQVIDLPLELLESLRCEDHFLQPRPPDPVRNGREW